MPRVRANGIPIEVERHGAADGIPLLLVRGLGSQIVHWPPALIDGFVANGFHVIAYDNRDAGLSCKFDESGVPDIAAVRRKIGAGENPDVPYRLADMAADGIGVLDALNIRRAHVFGTSMGGMIVQLMAHAHPRRIRSMTIVMSSSGDPALPPRKPEIERLLLSQPDDPNDRAQVIEHTLACDRVWGSPAYPFDENERRALIARAYERCHCPDGVTRQYAAMIAQGSRLSLLGAITTPTLVIHGTEDALLPIEHGRDLAAAIPGAELIEIEGMGHDLEGGIAQRVVAATSALARRSDERAASAAAGAPARSH